MKNKKKRDMKKISFAHDLNLDFPINELPWRDLFNPSVAYEDMSLMTQHLLSHQFDAAYLPAANHYYLRKDPFFQGMATALTLRDGKTTFKSLLVVKKESDFTSWHELQGKKIGYIHRYCTSSYFGAALFFYKKGVSLKFHQMIPVGAWQKQIDAVVEERVDATFVMEDVWLQRGNNQKATRIIDSIDSLPNPLMILAQNQDESLRKKLEQELLGRGENPSKQALFSRFTEYDSLGVETFFIDAEKALYLL